LQYAKLKGEGHQLQVIHLASSGHLSTPANSKLHQLEYTVSRAVSSDLSTLTH